MKAYRRSLLTLGLAALLPIVVFVAVQIVFTLRRDREKLEEVYLARASDVLRIVDARIGADLTALRILLSATLTDGPDWREFYLHAGRVLSENAHWVTIIVTEGDTDHVILDAVKPLEAPQSPFRLEPATVFVNERGVVGGIARRPSLGPTPYVYLQVPVLRNREVVYRVTLAVDPQIYQEVVLEHTEAGQVTGLVDRDGRFIGRSVNYQQRIGQPATQYLRKALAKHRGLYQGRTWEGMENVTAFSTSNFSGWSMHIAIPTGPFDSTQLWSYVVSGIAGLIALAVAALLSSLVLREMTERRRAEEASRQSQKLEAIGQLTGGIAHDFNNLLTAIIGGLDVITRRANDERIQRTAANALEAARRGAKLTSQLLAFSRKQPMAIGPVDLQALLDGMTALLAQSLGPSIRASIDIAPEARYARTDAAQLELSLLNLAVNARDAMPDGGSFSITSRPAEPTLCSHLPPGDYVQLEVADTGFGMSDEVRAHAFEPFFTTKPIGAGTGLGLSQVFGVVQQSRGAIHIHSAEGSGTTVIIVLPQAAAPVEVASPPANRAVAREAPVSSEPQKTILVVDDDRHVRRVMVESLRSRGYLVAEASGGHEALQLLAASRPDLLVIDFSMPYRNGAEVASDARRMHPGLRVLLVSGHADFATITAAVGDVPLLHKPFDGETLAAAVARVLKGESVAAAAV